MDTELKKRFLSICPGRVFFNKPMRNHTSLRVGGKADAIFYPKDTEDLKKILTLARDQRLPYYILGKGTNLLVRDGGIRGIVINLGYGFKDVSELEDNGNSALIRAGTGVLLSNLLAYSVTKDLSGLEFAAGIPGSVGGAIAMNAGTRDGSIQDIISSITLMDYDREVFKRDRKGLRFSYRKLELAKHEIILEGIFKLKRVPKEEIKAKIISYMSHKKRSQPLNSASCGCIFKNPEGHFAGQLIEEAGLKGYRIGDAMISEVHANFIVNVGKAEAKDILNLMALIQKRIYEEKGIHLEPEVQIIGEDAI